MRIGYACINNVLAEKKIQVSRTIIKRTFLEKGISYASQLALNNVSDFSKIIEWNIQNNILLYRMSSDMFPWMSEYELSDLPDMEQIKMVLAMAGEKARQGELRLTFHPGQFDVLATMNQKVLQNTVKDLRQHGEIMDLIGLPRNHFAKINIHVGGAYGDKSSAIKRFVDNFCMLPDSVKTRLTVENDDKLNMFSVKDLLSIYVETGIPIVFDYLHHHFCTGDWSEERAFMEAIETWPSEITPIVHFSSSKKKFEDQNAAEVAHADYIYQNINCYGTDVDVMLEAKAKERAVIRYVSEYGNRFV